jgi:hypothetical protein
VDSTATGMPVLVTDLADARARRPGSLARLRARAWGDGRLPAEVAADVVARRLRFDDANL